MRRAVIHATTLIGVIAAAGACSIAGDRPAAGRDRVRVAALPFLSLMPFHIAQAEGFFDEQNLEVEFLTLTRNQDIMTSLAHGDVDATGGMFTLNELSLIAAGAHIRIVAALTGPPSSVDRCPEVAVMIRREHLASGAARDPARVRRMRFDLSPFIPLGYAVDELLRPLGLGIDDVETVDLTPPAALEAMRTGQIDVTVDAEPYLSLHAAGGEAATWRSVYDLIPSYVHSVVTFGPTLLGDRPDVGRRFLTAVLKGMRQYRLGKSPRNLAIVEEASGLTAEQVSGTCWPVPTSDGRVDPAAFRGYQEWSVRRRLLDRVLADEEVVEGGFIEFANAELDR